MIAIKKIIIIIFFSTSLLTPYFSFASVIDLNKNLIYRSNIINLSDIYENVNIKVDGVNLNIESPNQLKLEINFKIGSAPDNLKKLKDIELYNNKLNPPYLNLIGTPNLYLLPSDQYILKDVQIIKNYQPINYKIINDIDGFRIKNQVYTLPKKGVLFSWIIDSYDNYKVILSLKTAKDFKIYNKIKLAFLFPYKNLYFNNIDIYYDNNLAHLLRDQLIFLNSTKNYTKTKEKNNYFFETHNNYSSFVKEVDISTDNYDAIQINSQFFGIKIWWNKYKYPALLVIIILISLIIKITRKSSWKEFFIMIIKPFLKLFNIDIKF